jgi:2-polyprenyl-6-hydroxyphenyl methylase/3-demethylubiquinone-9 3-methyltransferase
VGSSAGHAGGVAPPVRPLNDPGQYDDLADQWWDTGGVFAMLHWLAAERARLVPPAVREHAVLLDIACGAGLLAPHVHPLGYRHVGVDIGRRGLELAAARGVLPVRADALRLPLADRCADVVVAGEVLEHVRDPYLLVEETCRVLRPGGTVVIDSIAAGRWGRFTAVTVAERIPGGPPPRLHDPALFVDPAGLRVAFARHGIRLRLHGLLPDPLDYLRWCRHRDRPVRMRRVPGTAGLFGGSGVQDGS